MILSEVCVCDTKKRESVPKSVQYGARIEREGVHTALGNRPIACHAHARKLDIKTIDAIKFSLRPAYLVKTVILPFRTGIGLREQEIGI